MLIILMPYYAARMIRRGGYAKDFSHRFGSQNDLPEVEKGKKRLWIQAVSVGEVEAIATLLKLLKESGRYEVVLTTTTSTAYKIIREKYKDLCYYVGIFPFDFFLTNHRAWRRIKPDAIVLMEGELWPEHLHTAKMLGKPLFLLNARMSDKSFSRYSKVKFLAKRIFSKFDAIACGSEFDAQRFLALGANPQKISVSGNIKFDSKPDKILTASQLSELKKEMGFSENSLVLLGSSTWEGEEKMLVQFAKNFVSKNPQIDLRLLIVPRHAERRAQVKEMLQGENVKFHFRSEQKQAPEKTFVYVGDTTGELRVLTQVADFAFVGKSMNPHMGGQSPLDCAASGVALVYGKNMTNFRQMCKTLEEHKASIKVEDEQEAYKVLTELALDPSKRDSLSQNALAWHTSNVGASARTFEVLEKVLSK